jgi:hypothetical protein
VTWATLLDVPVMVQTPAGIKAGGHADPAEEAADGTAAALL